MMPADAFGWLFDGSGRRVAAVAATAIRATATKPVIVRCFVMGTSVPQPTCTSEEWRRGSTLHQIKKGQDRRRKLWCHLTKPSARDAVSMPHNAASKTHSKAARTV